MPRAASRAGAGSSSRSGAASRVTPPATARPDPATVPLHARAHGADRVLRPRWERVAGELGSELDLVVDVGRSDRAGGGEVDPAVAHGPPAGVGAFMPGPLCRLHPAAMLPADANVKSPAAPPAAPWPGPPVIATRWRTRPPRDRPPRRCPRRRPRRRRGRGRAQPPQSRRATDLDAARGAVHRIDDPQPPVEVGVAYSPMGRGRRRAPRSAVVVSARHVRDTSPPRAPGARPRVSCTRSPRTRDAPVQPTR